MGEIHSEAYTQHAVCLYLMGLNLSNEQIAAEVDLPVNEVQTMTSQLREGIVVKKSQLT